ncbi:MAG: response regulator [Chromatiaceae bacterium]|jgi:two-component system invasion response regulator UvrY
MARIYVVDDYDLVRAGIRSLLESQSESDLIDEFASGEQVLAACRKTSPDVILIDVGTPRGGGAETVRRLARIDPSIRIIAITALDSGFSPLQLLDAGAHGYLTKTSGRDEMLEAVRAVRQGHCFISSDAAKTFTPNERSGQGVDSPISRLTVREMQVMMMVIRGHANREISAALFLSPKTVYTYRARVLDKLNLANDVELTHFGIRHGLIDPRA